MAEQLQKIHNDCEKIRKIAERTCELMAEVDFSREKELDDLGLTMAHTAESIRSTLVDAVMKLPSAEDKALQKLKNNLASKILRKKHRFHRIRGTIITLN